MPWSTGLDRAACAVVDQIELFGLDALPDSCQEITALTSGAVLSGTVRCAVGRDLLLDTHDGPLLADTRLVTGWPLHPSTAAPTSLQLPPPMPPCSDTGTGWYPVLVLDGMPGTGKTTTATALAALHEPATTHEPAHPPTPVERSARLDPPRRVLHRPRPGHGTCTPGSG